MDVALKQRLVGASVLVIFGVTFIPMLLDGPPAGRVENSIQIPNPPDQRFETRLLPVNPSEGTTEEAPETAEETPAPARVIVSPTPTTTEAAPVDGSVSTAPPEVVDAPADPEPEPVQVAAASAARSGTWVLQVGSFGNAANAARVVTQLTEAGWEAFQDKVNVGDSALYRVRVRGWAEKAAAAAAGERLLAAFPDLDLSVRQAQQAAAAPAPSLKGWMIQLGSFNSENNALALRDRLRAGGFSAHLFDAGADRGGRYRVRVGPELDEASAAATRDRIRSAFELRGILVDHP